MKRLPLISWANPKEKDRENGKLREDQLSTTKFKKGPYMQFKSLIFTISTFLCLFNIYGQENRVNFDEEYIKQNENNVSVEINEVQELVYIILANTNLANDTPGMVNQDMEYYKEMKKHFSEYSDLSVVKKFNKLLEENLLYYFMLAANAYGYEFEGNNIVPTGIYIFPGKGVGNLKVEQNPIETYITELEEFAKETKFREFYKRNKSYYDKLKSDTACWSNARYTYI